jgi:hypothetical protein
VFNRKKSVRICFPCCFVPVRYTVSLSRFFLHAIDFHSPASWLIPAYFSTVVTAEHGSQIFLPSSVARTQLAFSHALDQDFQHEFLGSAAHTFLPWILIWVWKEYSFPASIFTGQSPILPLPAVSMVRRS